MKCMSKVRSNFFFHKWTIQWGLVGMRTGSVWGINSLSMGACTISVYFPILVLPSVSIA